jgi:formylglycine-generating enzyme required for sulfatase activity
MLSFFPYHLFHKPFIAIVIIAIALPTALLATETNSCCLTPSSRISQLINKDASVPSAKNSEKNTNSGEASSLESSNQVDQSQWPSKPWPKGMVWIPGGEFQMGGVGPEARKDEFPIHAVKVDGFWMDETVITNEAFRRFVKATGYLTTAEQPPDWEAMKKMLPPGTPKPDASVLVPGSLVFVPTEGPVPLNDPSQWWQWVPGASWQHPFGPNSKLEAKDDAYPVVQVSWDDAVAYCKWAGKRLPTEAEWEYACLGGGPARRFLWGDEPPSDTFHPANLWQGVFPYEKKPLDGYLYTAPARSFKPNGYGLYNMIGNVWQWCSDWYRSDYYETLASGTQPSQNPQGPPDSFDPEDPYTPKRVNRGGSFLCNEGYCASYRPAARMKTSPDSGLLNVGFRPVLSESEWRKQNAPKKH